MIRIVNIIPIIKGSVSVKNWDTKKLVKLNIWIIATRNANKTIIVLGIRGCLNNFLFFSNIFNEGS